jgi:hypothetical protein
VKGPPAGGPTIGRAPPGEKPFFQRCHSEDFVGSSGNQQGDRTSFGIIGICRTLTRWTGRC